MKAHTSIFLLITLYMACFGCTSEKKTEAVAEKVSVQWELLSNFIDEKNTFEAKFTLTNKSNVVLTNKNWALFFNMSPRPILKAASPQPAIVQHINGDWYKLTPDSSFSLAQGKSADIIYRGSEGIIKETDAPQGLYFVFYIEKGEEDKIVEVTDYKITPFTRQQQLNRNKQDAEAIPTTHLRYTNNLALNLLPASQLQSIIPSPVKIHLSSGSMEVNAQTEIHYGKGLENEANYLANSLKDLTGNTFKTSETAPGTKGIHLAIGPVKVNGVDKEAYTLKIADQGITITGSDPAGVFYGIQSLRSLIPLEVYSKTSAVFTLPFASIEDAPRFSFRGLHMDVGRNFQTKETILRTLDLLSFYKINRFLFYMTEDEGWRLEIDGLPELTQVGAQREHTTGKETPVLHPAYGSGPFAKAKNKHGSGYYSRKDFIEIIKYASERHIKVIPEVNFPGHARAAIKSMEARYQRLMKEGKEAEANEYRLIDPNDKSVYLSAQAYTDNVVDVTKESTYHFYEKVVDEISKMYTEAGLTLDEFHTGGDEVPEGAWTKSPLASALLAKHTEIKDPKNLHAYFFSELLRRLEKRKLQVHGWEEVALLKTPEGKYVPNAEFANKNVVPYIWNNLFDYDLGYRLANAGYKVVLCNVSNFYFDLAYNKDPKEPGLYWAGFVDTRNAWTFAPFDMFKTTAKTSLGKKIDMATEFAHVEKLKPETRKNILGIEAQLWSETIKGSDMIEYYMLPKLMGFAESAWASERAFETIEDETKREDVINKSWNVFANTLGQKELARLSYLNRGYNYRIPVPGAILTDGILKANTEYPGLIIRYTTDGSEPDKNSPVYTKPVPVSGTIKVKSFDTSGKSSRSVQVTSEEAL